MGLSCESCHAGARINPHFYLPELSDAPGTADVTSEWASKVRGDGMRNPVAIPDLVGVRDKTSLGHNHEPSLEVFVREGQQCGPTGDRLIQFFQVHYDTGSTQVEASSNG